MAGTWIDDDECDYKQRLSCDYGSLSFVGSSSFTREFIDRYFICSGKSYNPNGLVVCSVYGREASIGWFGDVSIVIN